VRLYGLRVSTYFLRGSIIIRRTVNDVTCVVGFQPQQWMVIQTWRFVSGEMWSSDVMVYGMKHVILNERN
jgi:hypothetical protein